VGSTVADAGAAAEPAATREIEPPTAFDEDAGVQPEPPPF
jgi:hypothetical protein